MPALNRYAFTATKSNSYSVTSWLERDIGDEYVHSIHGRGIIVHCDRTSGRMTRYIVRTDVTLEQLIDAL